MVQGYPQRMRLQRRLYEIFLHFLGFRDPCRPKLPFYSVLNNLEKPSKIQLNANTKNQTSNRHIFGVLELNAISTILLISKQH